MMNFYQIFEQFTGLKHYFIHIQPKTPETTHQVDDQSEITRRKVVYRHKQKIV